MLNTPYDHEDAQPELRAIAAEQAHIRRLNQIEAEARAQLAIVQTQRSKLTRFPVERTTGIGGAL